jgi:hypothetical protein
VLNWRACFIVRVSGANFNNTSMIKYLIFSCLTAVALISLAGCASNAGPSTTSESTTATMSTDTKDMNSHK